MHQKVLLSEKVADSIIEGIRSDFYRVGEKMPNEIQWAEELGVSRATLREAIKHLVGKNYLEVRRGLGTFVSDTPGFLMDAVGRANINWEGQYYDVLLSMRFLQSQILPFFSTRAWDEQKNLLDQMRNFDRLPLGIFNAINHMTNVLFEQKNAQFLNQLLRITQEGFLQVSHIHEYTYDENLAMRYDDFISHLGSDQAIDYYEALLHRLNMLVEAKENGLI